MWKYTMQSDVIAMQQLFLLLLFRDAGQTEISRAKRSSIHLLSSKLTEQPAIADHWDSTGQQNLLRKRKGMWLSKK